MKIVDLSKRRTRHPLRSVVGALLMCSGCSEEPKPPEIVPAKEVSVPKVLTVLTWEDYFSPAVIEGFEKEFGVEVRFESFNNLDEMEALLRSRPSDFDLVLTSGIKIPDLVSLQLIQPLKKESLPHLGNMDERFLGLAGDPQNQFSVPYMWGPTLIAYRSDKIKDPLQSWNSLWDARYQGRVLMLEETFDAYSAALLALGHDPNSQDPAHLESATQLLIKQVESVKARFVDINEIRDSLLSGECWITMTYSSDAAVLAEKEENISYFIPLEGTALWLDSFVIPRESTNPGNAHLFLDYFCRPEVAAANSNELWCASANREVRPFIKEEILEDPTIYLSDEVLTKCHVEAQSSPERQQTINQGFKRLFDLVRENRESIETATASPDQADAPRP